MIIKGVIFQISYIFLGRLVMYPYLNNMSKKKEYIHTVRAEIVVQSHLSDAILETWFDNSGIRPQVHLRMEFVKYLVNMLNGDLTQEIDPDALYKQFSQKRDTLRGMVEIVEY